MKNIGLGIGVIIIIALAIAFNLNSVIFGGKVPIQGFLSTGAYLITWILGFKYLLKKERYNFVLFSIVYWTFTCLTAIVGLYIYISGIIFSQIIPFVFIFITPLIGLKFMGQNTIIFIILIIIGAGCFIYFGVKSIIKSRR